MIEKRRLKNVVTFIQTILGFVLSRNIGYMLFMSKVTYTKHESCVMKITISK